MIKHRYIFGVCLLSILLLPGTLVASLVEIGLDNEFSGGDLPAGVAPYVVVGFDPGPVLDSVVISIENSGLTDDEFLSKFYMNLDPTMDPTLLSITPLSKTGTFLDPTVNLGVDAFKADGDGKYDILLNFSTDEADRFGAGEVFTFRIDGPSGLDVFSFNELSLPDGGHGPFLLAGHVQGITINEEPSGSGWISPGDGGLVPFPEPATVILLSTAAPLFLVKARKR